MLHGSAHPTPIPLRAALATLMRDARATGGNAETVPTDPEPETEATAPPKPPAAVRRREASEAFIPWMHDVLGPKRGVVAALPKPADGTVRDAIVALDGTRLGGQSQWWLWNLHKTPLGEPSYTSGGAAVYRAPYPEWFPFNDSYEADEREFELLSAAGVAVTVREIPAWPTHADTLPELPLLAQRLLLELEAAACGAGPAVFGAFLVHEGDDFGALREKAGGGALDEGSDFNTFHRRIAACVTVTQTHGFRLSELLENHSLVLGDAVLRPGAPQLSLERSIFEATASIARKLRFLARNRILKVNITPETIVFCPVLVETDDALEATGFGYTDPSGREVTRGAPRLSDFDPAMSRRGKDVDPDCAYALMVLVLLASVRAQHGEIVNVMLYKLTGKGIDGAALPESELPENWSEISLPMALQGARAGSGSFCGMLRAHAALAEVADSFEALLSCKVLLGGTFDKPVFTQLVCKLLHSSGADTNIFAPPLPRAEANAELERVGRLMRRLDTVRLARESRARERLERAS